MFKVLSEYVSDDSLKEFLEDFWYPTAEIILYPILGIIGTITNVLICIVVIRNKSMRTAANFYLFNLAVSDLTTLFFLNGSFFEVIYNDHLLNNLIW